MALGLVNALEWAHQWWGPLSWLVLLVFLSGTVIELYDRRLARYVLVGGWGVLALFWVSAIYQFVFDQKSITEGIAVVLAIPLSLYVGYLLASGRDRLIVVSRAVAVGWLIYLPFSTLPFLRNPLIAIVTDQTATVLSLIGADFEVIAGNNFPADLGPAEPVEPYQKTFFFHVPDVRAISYTIMMACTGIGSMAIFGGLIAAVRAPLARKLKALAVAVGIIWVLNIARNVFIAYSFGYQRLQIFPEFVMSVFGIDSRLEVSYIVADRILAQFLSVFALVGITYVVIKILPEVLTIVDEALYVLTRNEYDLQDALDVEARADGGSERRDETV
ncbi:archaeosortase A [Halapricum hydrolyticum]|uniref:Archaeosortase A n=1 Tax=Halapricum hydrolyticum TaxID=2979991 RepID=A0AAE3LE17_9EURY|nr:archaeosortase A [Halapricum hydrolyticum]MCU4716618.1 archaeosortase A [Halapricum hydrolyticum]MCU4725777.1 archaeosortase A [Halapricum hydrolyticum]